MEESLAYYINTYGATGCDLDSSAGVVNFSYFNAQITGDPNGGDSGYPESVTVTPTGLGFTFTGTRETGVTGQTGFGAAPGAVAFFELFYFATALNPRASFTGVGVSIADLQSEGSGAFDATFANVNKRVSTNVQPGNFNEIAGSILGGSETWVSVNALGGALDIDISGESEDLVWPQQGVQVIRVRDSVFVTNSTSGRSGLTSVTNSPFVVAAIPEPASMGLIGLGLMAIGLATKRVRR